MIYSNLVYIVQQSEMSEWIKFARILCVYLWNDSESGANAIGFPAYSTTTESLLYASYVAYRACRRNVLESAHICSRHAQHSNVGRASVIG